MPEMTVSLFSVRQCYHQASQVKKIPPSQTTTSTLWVINFPRTNFYKTADNHFHVTPHQPAEPRDATKPWERDDKDVDWLAGWLTNWLSVCCCLCEIGRAKNVWGKIMRKGCGWVGRQGGGGMWIGISHRNKGGCGSDFHLLYLTYEPFAFFFFFPFSEGLGQKKSYGVSSTHDFFQHLRLHLPLSNQSPCSIPTAYYSLHNSTYYRDQRWEGVAMDGGVCLHY